MDIMAKKTNLKQLLGIDFQDNVKRPAKKGFDVTFLLLVIIMTCTGLIMLLSASAPAASTKYGNAYHYFFRQFMFAVAGFFIMLGISNFDYRRYKPFAKAFMILCVILLFLVLVIGVEHQGARRWLNTGIEWQPSEIMKLAIAMYFARMVEDGKTELKSIKSLLPYGGWMLVTAALLMLETHLSGTIIICGIGFVILIAAGARIRYFLGMAAVGGPIAVLLLKMDPVRWSRVENLFDPFSDMQGVGYQVVQGLYAIATGGFFGLGLGQSVQKYSYLPEPYNDFIFAIICEEMGLFGALMIIFLFAALIIRGIKIASETSDVFGSLMVTGIMAQIAIQTILNIAVVTSTIPNTGVALPFFSYGGTSLVMLFAEMGIVLNVSRYSRKGI